MTRPVFRVVVWATLATFAAFALGACASAPPNPGGSGTVDNCPPAKPWPPRDGQMGPGNKGDWRLRHTDDGHGHDVEVWCLDLTPKDASEEQISDPAYYHFAYRASHPDGTGTWFAKCVFDRGQNYRQKLEATNGSWTGVVWKNVDPKDTPDYPQFNDIEYDYSWLFNTLTVSLTQNGKVVKKKQLTPTGNDHEFEKQLEGLIKELIGAATPLTPGSNCTSAAG